MSLIERLMFNRINARRKYHGISLVSANDFLYSLYYCYDMKLNPTIQNVEECIAFKIAG